MEAPASAARLTIPLARSRFAALSCGTRMHERLAAGGACGCADAAPHHMAESAAHEGTPNERRDGPAAAALTSTTVIWHSATLHVDASAAAAMIVRARRAGVTAGRSLAATCMHE